MFSNSGLVIVASDGAKQCTLVDISTSMEQIVGRLRENSEYQNRFKNHIIHVYSTVNYVESDAKFSEQMKKKEAEADNIISGFSKMDDKEKDTYQKHLDIETTLITYENGFPVKSDLKRRCFDFKHQLKKYYKDGIFIQRRYEKSEKFSLDHEEKEWKNLDEKLSQLVVVNYKELLENYLDSRDPDYLRDYPEFSKIARYLTEKEMNSCKRNKEKMIKRADDKMQMDKVFLNIYEEDKFFTNAELKKRLQDEFDRLGITMKAKATLIKDCKLYEIDKTKTGYKFGKRILDFTIE